MNESAKKQTGPKKTTILCMYSGGLDSVGALYRLCTDPKYAGYRIHVHHMHLHNIENRARAEMIATRRTLATFARLGHKLDLFTQSAHEYTFMRGNFVWDMDMCAFMSANMTLINPSIRHVAMGRTKTDVDSGSDDFSRRMERAQAVFRAVRMLAKAPAGYIFPVVDMTKREIWDMLPDPLRRAAWSCRQPVYDGRGAPRPCGRCQTCLEIKEFVLDKG